MRIFGVIPFNTVKNDEKWDRELIKPLICFGLSYVVFVSRHDVESQHASGSASHLEGQNINCCEVCSAV